MRKTFVSFIVLLTLAVGGATWGYRALQRSELAPRAEHTRSLVHLTDTDKRLIDARDSLSKWLLGLAVALLPGVVLRRTEDGEAYLKEQLLPMLAGALLVTSVYGFFLAQDSIILVLSQGPQYHLYGPFSDFPILVQFWSLVTALSLMLLHWLKPNTGLKFPPILGASILTVGVFVAHPSATEAAEARPEAALDACVVRWSDSREMGLASTQVSMAAKVMRGVAKRAGVSPVTCGFVTSQLDQFRWYAFKERSSDVAGQFSELLAIADKDLRSMGMTESEVLEKLLQYSTIWRAPSAGLLVIKGKPSGAQLLLNGVSVGLTDFEIRLAPKTYHVEVLKGGKRVYVNESAKVVEGERCVLTFGD